MSIPDKFSVFSIALPQLSACRLTDIAFAELFLSMSSIELIPHNYIPEPHPSSPTSCFRKKSGEAPLCSGCAEQRGQVQAENHSGHAQKAEKTEREESPRRKIDRIMNRAESAGFSTDPRPMRGSVFFLITTQNIKRIIGRIGWLLHNQLMNDSPTARLCRSLRLWLHLRGS